MTAPPALSIAQTTPARAREVHRAEFQRLLELIATFTEEDWARPTDCEGWDVRQMLAHLAGACDEALHLRVFLRHWVWGPKRRYPRLSRLDAANQCQIDDRRDRSGAQIAAELADIGPKAVEAAGTMFRRRFRLPKSDPLLPGESVVYMCDVIAIRDTWMHRLDAARATSREFVIDGHDHEVVAQVVRDLGRHWEASPVRLELTGPAGGVWTLGEGPPAATVRVDAVEYLRTLSGRHDTPALDGTGDNSAVAAAGAARVVF
ncbi:MAG: maleylpyruvate isomerase family mycothiol-dependent enzyme [Actinomycetota bacterium]